MANVLRPVPKSHGAERLVVFHHAGGNANQFLPKLRNWQEKFDILMMDLPGRNFRIKEAAFSDPEKLFDALFDELSNLPAKPTYFLGHSMGALIAFEMAWRISEKKLFPIKRVALSALRPPGSGPKIIRLSTLPDEEFIREVESFSPFPGFVRDNPDLMKLSVQVIRNDLALMEGYQNKHKGILPVPTIVLGGEDDPKISPNDLEGWRNLVDLKGAVRVYSGAHFFIFAHLDECIGDLVRP
jgi:surfactin synthase thioesterase subunit